MIAKPNYRTYLLILAFAVLALVACNTEQPQIPETQPPSQIQEDIQSAINSAPVSKPVAEVENIEAEWYPPVISGDMNDASDPNTGGGTPNSGGGSPESTQAQQVNTTATNTAAPGQGQALLTNPDIVPPFDTTACNNGTWVGAPCQLVVFPDGWQPPNGATVINIEDALNDKGLADTITGHAVTIDEVIAFYEANGITDPESFAAAFEKAFGTPPPVRQQQ